MSTFDSPPDDLQNRADFDGALNRLIQEAVDRGIDINGGYRAESQDLSHDFGIEIYRVVPTN